MRLPGFWHLKAKPFRSRIILGTDGEGPPRSKRYDLAEIEQTHPCDFQSPSLRSNTPSRSDTTAGWDNECDMAHFEGYLKKDARPALEGQGGDKTTYEVACVGRDFGLPEPRVYELMLQHYNPRCEPPWDAVDLKRKVQNAFEYANGEAGSRSLARDFRDTTDSEIVEIQRATLRMDRSGNATDCFENAVAAMNLSGITPAWDELKQNAVFRQPKLPWAEHYGRNLNDHVSRMLRLFLVSRFDGVSYSPSKDNLLEATL